MKLIMLTQGKYTKVDDNLFETLNQHKWTHMKGYVIRFIGGRKNPKCLYMHREILGTPEGMFTDHIDHDGLNNQLNNLRIVNKSQNMLNCNIPKDNTSGYKGVSKTYIVWMSKKTGEIKRKLRWKAEITISSKHYSLGKFKTLQGAVTARRKAEEQFWLHPIK